MNREIALNPVGSLTAHKFIYILMLLLTVPCFTGCFINRLSPEAEATFLKAKELESTGKKEELCKLVTSSKDSSSDTLYMAGECAEQGLAGKAQAITYYKDAASCGNLPAREKLLAIDGSKVDKTYALGDTSILLNDASPDACSYDREVTTTGWVVAPVAVPAYVVGATAVGATAVAIAVAFLSLAILSGGGL